MYEQHFGLSKRPFSVKATGTGVFVGPQTAKTMAGFRKALTVQDAVVTVSGLVGTGKTTLVERALDALGSKYKTIRVGRMQMNASDVLESLLIVLGVKDRPSGTIQRFTALRKKLKQLQDAETRVFILVEDALRAGLETLAELEALTVADAGESNGASIVVMGDERLFEFMKDSQLAQLQQRVRQRHQIKPLCVAELRGYLKHCFRLAGGDFEQIFDTRSAELLHGLSAGIPRVANNLGDAVLVAAASQGIKKISAQMVATVAAEEFGLSVDDFDFSEAVADDVAVPEPAPTVHEDVAAEAGIEKAPEAAPVVVADAEPIPEPQTASAVAERPVEVPEPVIVFTDDEDESPEGSADIPHLIQDTLPDLAILSKRYAALEESYAPDAEETETAPTTADAGARIPELKPEPAADVAAEKSPEPQSDEQVEEIPELAKEPPTATEANWEVAREPEFELVKEAKIALQIETAPEPADEEIPELQAELVPAPVGEEIPGLVVEANKVSEPETAVPETPEPQLVAEVTSEPEAPPVPEAEPQSERTPEAESKSESPPAEVPEWERDPTLAQLKPDLDALEQAMAFTHGEPLAAGKKAAPQPEELAASIVESEELPEIILDKSIETGVENLDFEEPSEILRPAALKKSDPQLDRIAADIANAKSIEDIDDIMAETLFGTGISMIAAQITANPPRAESANDALEQAAESPATPSLSIDELELVAEPPESPSPPVEEKAAPVGQQGNTPMNDFAGEEISIETRPPVANTGLDLSASQRLKTVRALNADLHPSLREPGNDGAVVNPMAAPEPIEDQINTSITQTLKTLKIPPPALDDEPDDEPKKGFLSRFRRS